MNQNDFLFALGQVMGGIKNEEVIQWLKDRTITEEEIKAFTVAALALCRAAYHDEGETNGPASKIPA